MTESYLSLDERKQLIELLTNDGDILTVEKRRALLENAGLASWIPQIAIEGETNEFAQNLVRLLEQKGIFNAAGAPPSPMPAPPLPCLKPSNTPRWKRYGPKLRNGKQARKEKREHRCRKRIASNAGGQMNA